MIEFEERKNVLYVLLSREILLTTFVFFSPLISLVKKVKVEEITIGQRVLSKTTDKFSNTKAKGEPRMVLSVNSRIEEEKTPTT